MHYFSLLLLAFALSIDSFGVGLSYGLKQVRIKLMPVMIIGLSSAFVMTLAIFAGRFISGFIPNHMEAYIGGGILIALGLWQLTAGWNNSRLDRLAANDCAENPILLTTINLKAFGLILQILREPVKADLDKSGDINFKEAVLLGIALNIDAFGAGVGAGIAGYSVFLIPIVAISLLISISLGLLIGKKYAGKFGDKVYLLPGTILVLLGIADLFR